jgi:hypothetical protein
MEGLAELELVASDAAARQMDAHAACAGLGPSHALELHQTGYRGRKCAASRCVQKKMLLFARLSGFVGRL